MERQHQGTSYSEKTKIVSNKQDRKRNTIDMIIQSSCQECTSLIVGVCGSSSFYEKFDKVLKQDYNQVTIANLQDKNYLEKLFKLMRKIRAHWNKKDDSTVKSIIKDNLVLCGDFLNAPEKHYKELILSTQGIREGFQNTKVSKFLYILKPDFIPMLDHRQGKVLIKKYNIKSRDDLIKAIRTLHKHFNCNRRNVTKIHDVLRDEHDISLSELRVFELLIWLQAQLNEKGIKKQIFKN